MPRAVSRGTRRSRTRTALDLLKQDHAEVSKLFKQFERYRKDDDSAGMQACAQAACRALAIHAQIEEEIFYPALRESADAEDALDEADIEHSHIKELVGQLEGSDPDDEHFEARVKVLSEYVRHHVEEEEHDLCEGAQIGLRSRGLGEQLQARKAELGGEDASAELAAPAATRGADRARSGQRATR
jgi:hemerythrin superfamily protein